MHRSTGWNGFKPQQPAPDTQACGKSSTGALTDLRHDIVLEGQAAGIDELVEGADKVSVTGMRGRKQVGIYCGLLAHLVQVRLWREKRGGSNKDDEQQCG